MLSDDGKKSEFDSPENLKALQLMVDGIKNGAAPKAVTTYMEQETAGPSRAASATSCATGRTRTPPARRTQKVAGKFEVAPFPDVRGRAARPASSAATTSVISVYTKNPGGALKCVDYLDRPRSSRSQAREVLARRRRSSSAYDDPDVKKALPYAAELKQAIEQAKSRPVSPVYPQISQAIYKNVNEALSGAVSPEEALKKARRRSNRRCRPSRIMEAASDPVRPAPRGGAPGESRSAAWRG